MGRLLVLARPWVGVSVSLSIKFVLNAVDICECLSKLESFIFSLFELLTWTAMAIKNAWEGNRRTLGIQFLVFFILFLVTLYFGS